MPGSLCVVFALRRAALSDFTWFSTKTIATWMVWGACHNGNPVASLLQNLGQLDYCSGAHHRILLAWESSAR